MEDTLVIPLLATEPADLSELVRQLRREVLELRQEVADLRRENAELRQQVGYWKAMHARAVHRTEHLEAEVEQLRGENRKLQDQLFGRKSEKSSTRDRSNHLEGEDDDDDSATPRSGASGRIGLARDGGTTATYRSSRTSASCPRTGASVPSAGQRSRPAIPRIPNRSRSISRPIGGGSGGDVISGLAPVKTVLGPSPLRRRRS